MSAKLQEEGALDALVERIRSLLVSKGSAQGCHSILLFKICASRGAPDGVGGNCRKSTGAAFERSTAACADGMPRKTPNKTTLHAVLTLMTFQNFNDSDCPQLRSCTVFLHLEVPASRCPVPQLSRGKSWGLSPCVSRLSCTARPRFPNATMHVGCCRRTFFRQPRLHHCSSALHRPLVPGKEGARRDYRFLLPSFCAAWRNLHRRSLNLLIEALLRSQDQGRANLGQSPPMAGRKQVLSFCNSY